MQSKYHRQLDKWFYTLTCLHFSEVMSSWRATTFGMGLMGTKSTPNERRGGVDKKRHFVIHTNKTFQFKQV